jgi:GT2 family glycosyltransferase
MVSIVIVNWNSGPFLERCLRSLREHATGCEIILIDNASQDGSADFARNMKFPGLLIWNKTNAGFGPACNQGWKAARESEILLLNPDTECLPNSVAELAQRLLSSPDCWAAGGRVINRQGKNQPGFNLRALPEMGSTAAELLLLDELWPGNRWTRSHRMANWNYDRAGEVEQPAAACLMVRRSALEKIGGFDERFIPAWFEDVDLCKRIHDAGGKILYEPEARFVHEGGISLRTLAPEEFLRCYHRNQILYFRKHYGDRSAERVRRLVIAGMRMRATLLLFHSRKRSVYWKTARYFAKSPEGKA